MWAVASSIALASFGLPFDDDAERASDQRAKTTVRLLTELGPNVRLIHGTADGLLGSLGSPPGVHYGPILPGFARCLSALMALEFGQAAEMPVT